VVVSNDGSQGINFNYQDGSLKYWKKMIPSLEKQGVPALELNQQKDKSVIKYKVTVLKKKRRNRKHFALKKKREYLRNKKLEKFLEHRPPSINFKWPENIVMNYRREQKQNVRVSKLLYQRKFLSVNEKHMGKLMVVMRIRENHGATPQIKQKLRGLGLHRVGWTVFLRYTKHTAFNLKLLEPFVTFGLPSEQVVRDMITKRAHVVTHKGEKMPLQNNVVVEQNFGKLNIVCMEDIIHEIYKNGPNFEAVVKFLLPFRLKPSAYRKTRIPFKKGGDSGWRGKKINDLLERLI
jgi:large subunit ribosomal protein L7e